MYPEPDARKANAKDGGYCVYPCLDETGTVVYVGTGKSLERRAGSELRRRAVEFAPIPGLSDLSRTDARAVE
jgi:hypothetical protein